MACIQMNNSIIRIFKWFLILHRYENPGMLKAGTCNSVSCFQINNSVIRFIHICKKRRNQTVKTNLSRKHAAHLNKKLKFPYCKEECSAQNSPIFVSGKSNYKET